MAYGVSTCCGERTTCSPRQSLAQRERSPNVHSYRCCQSTEQPLLMTFSADGGYIYFCKLFANNRNSYNVDPFMPRWHEKASSNVHSYSNLLIFRVFEMQQAWSSSGLYSAQECFLGPTQETWEEKSESTAIVTVTK